jgi:hypothetical protein
MTVVAVLGGTITVVVLCLGAGSRATAECAGEEDTCIDDGSLYANVRHCESG